MVKSYKMVLLLAMLNEDALPGEITIDRLTRAFAEAAGRSATLRQDVTVPLDDTPKLQRLLEENPIAALTGGKGTGGVSYFAYDDGQFRFAKQIATDQREAFQELVREITDWRLAEYRQRDAGAREGRYVCKVSHSNRRPMLFLPDRTRLSRAAQRLDRHLDRRRDVRSQLRQGRPQRRAPEGFRRE